MTGRELIDLFESSSAAGEIEYVTVGDLIAAVPAAQLDRWLVIVAKAAAVDELLEAPSAASSAASPRRMPPDGSGRRGTTDTL